MRGAQDYILGISFWCPMNVLSLIRKDRLPVQPDQLLGKGVDGEVFSIIDEPTKVIKFIAMVDLPNRKRIDSYNQLLSVCRLICRMKSHDTPVQSYVQVYDYGYLGMNPSLEGPRYLLFFYTMEKLREISEDEKRIFHSILSHEDFGKKKDLSSAKVEELISGMSALDFDPKKVRLFCDNIKAAPLSHLDMHTRNIMKDDMGNFKLIDLDRVTLENKDGKENY